MIRIRRLGEGKRYSDEMIDALRKMLAAYEAAIANPRRERPRWKNYCCFRSCSLCRAAVGAVSGYPECSVCILGPHDEGCAHLTMVELLSAIGHNRGFKKALIARRDWIIERCKENGVRVTITEEPSDE